jgi:hypothetical protein
MPTDNAAQHAHAQSLQVVTRAVDEDGHARATESLEVVASPGQERSLVSLRDVPFDVVMTSRGPSRPLETCCSAHQLIRIWDAAAHFRPGSRLQMS